MLRDGWEFEADQQLPEFIIDELGPRGAIVVFSPGEKLRQEGLENVLEIKESTPALIDDVQTDAAGILVNIGMVN